MDLLMLQLSLAIRQWGTSSKQQKITLPIAFASTFLAVAGATGDHADKDSVRAVKISNNTIVIFVA